MQPELNGYTLENLPDDSLICHNHNRKELPEVVGYCTLGEALSGADPKVLNTNYLFKYALKKELLGDGFYIPLPYGGKESGQVILVHCGYELILEQFYVNFALPLGLTEASVSLMLEKYNAYIGDRATREADAKLQVKLQELSDLTGTPIETLKKKMGIK